MNDGSGVLNISDIDIHTSQYSVSPAAAQLQPGDSTLVTVIFSPSGQSVFTDSVTIVSDDNSDPSINIYLTGQGITPVINFSTTSVSSLFSLICKGENHVSYTAEPKASLTEGCAFSQTLKRFIVSGTIIGFMIIVTALEKV